MRFGCGGSERAATIPRVPRDYYEILGVERDADAEAVKRAFRTHARDLHPDVSDDPDSADRFHEISEAYAVLSDERRRGLYDRIGWRGRGRGFAVPRGAARAYAANPRAFIADVESIIAASAGRKGFDDRTRVVGKVELDAYEAHVGATRVVDVRDAEPCAECDGDGRQKIVNHNETTRFVAFDDCPACHGTGELLTERQVEVTIPPRTRDDATIPVGPDEVVAVRIVRPPDRLGIRLLAAVVLLAAIGFLIFLLTL